MALLQDTHIWYLFSFIIFCAIAYKMGRHHVTSKLDSHISTIQSELEQAENLRVEAQELLAQYQRKHRDALKDADEIIENAKQHADEIRKNAEQEIDKQIARKNDQLEKRLKRMEQNAIEDMQHHASELAVKATREILTHHLDQEAQNKLTASSIQNVADRIAS
jgi:F-type H+-transporting ATPase subunit b